MPFKWIVAQANCAGAYVAPNTKPSGVDYDLARGMSHAAVVVV
jgi:hypothetical protein